MRNNNQNQVELYLKQAKQSYEHGHTNPRHYNHALDNYNQVINIDPLNEESYYLRACTLVKLERLKEALGDLDKALKLDPQYEKAHYERGNILFKLGKTNLAQESYSKVLEINPDNPDVQSMLAYNAGNYREAANYFNRILLQEPNNLDAYYYKGKALSQIGDYDEAMVCYKAVLNINPNFQAALYGQAELYYLLKNYDLAYQSFSKTQNFAVDAKYYMAKIHYDFQLYQSVASMLNPCKTVKEYNIKAMALRALEKYWSAANILEEAIILYPDALDSYVNYAALLVDLGKYDGALTYCDKAININPNIATIYYQKAEVLSLLWKKIEAIENLDKAIELDQQREVLYLCKKSGEYILIGNDKESFDCLEKAYNLVKAQGLNKELQENEVNYINTILNRFVNELYYEKIDNKKHLSIKGIITPIEKQLKEIYKFVTSKFNEKANIAVSKVEQELIDEYLSLINCDRQITLESILQTTVEDREAFKKYYEKFNADCSNVCKVDGFTWVEVSSILPDVGLSGNALQIGE